MYKTKTKKHYQKQLSKRLHQAHRKTRQQKALTITILIASLLSLIYLTTPSQAQTPAERQAFLPINQDIPQDQRDIWTKINILIKHLPPQERQEIKCTLYHESISTFGEDAGIAYNAYGNNPQGSVDRGIAMYNSYWRKDISNKCAFNITCSINNMIKDFKAGKKNQWYAYRKCKDNNFIY